MSDVPRARVGIVGYGELGRFLTDAILNHPITSGAFELGWVWNRSPDRIGPEVPEDARLLDLDDFASRPVDLVVEVAHPDITRAYGRRFLEAGDYLMGSPTALADAALEADLLAVAGDAGNAHGLYVPRGALPNLGDTLDLAAEGRIAEARIEMAKHPRSLAYVGPLEKPLGEVTAETVLHDGPLRGLCPHAPNNVNTMAVLALATGLGFDRIHARLVADPALEHHVTTVELLGPAGDGPRFALKMIRENPAPPGAVTGKATYASFRRSLERTVPSRGAGFHVV